MIDVRAVGVAGQVAETVVLSVVGDPLDHRSLDRGGAQDGEQRPHRPAAS